MKRFALLTVMVAAGVTAHGQTLFSDGFETGDFSKWAGVTGTGTDPGSIQNTDVHSGNFAARMSGSTTAGVVNGRYANLSRAELAGETIRYDFWMRIPTINGNHRHFAEIRSYAGDAYNTGSLEQLYAIGAWNAAVVNGTVNANKWQARIAFNMAGGPTVAGWYTLTEAGNRTTDWTKFTIEATPNTVQFYVNDVAGLASPLDRGHRGSLDSVVFGSRVSSVNVDAHFDDFSVQAVPEPATMAALGLGLAGIVARRRRKNA